MKNFFALFVFLVVFSTKVTAQTFTYREDSIIVDSFAKVLAPNHQMTGDPMKSVVSYKPDMRRPVWTIWVWDSLINFQYIEYDAIGRRTYEASGTCNLRADNHYYLRCNALETEKWIEKTEKLRKLLGG